MSFIGLVACKHSTLEKEIVNKEQVKYSEFMEENYESYIPNLPPKAVLILFGGFPESPSDIRREFDILDIVKENNIALILSTLNQKLWLEEDEKQELAKELQNIIEKHKLPTDNIYIGGFSSGGLVSMLISDFIVGMKQFYIDPKGVFIADSPIDLEALYRSSEKNLENNFSEPAIQESTWLIETLGSNFGNPKDNIQKYEEKAIFTYSTGNTSNLEKLRHTKIRLYTEPDTLWWKENRMAEFDQMNAFYIEKLAAHLEKKGFENVEYIPTKNKGYRANGDRHPHSWSIIDKEELIEWMLEK